MNKIIMNNNIENVIINNFDANLEIKKDTHITIFNNEINILSIKVLPSVKAVVNDFRIINNSKTNINIVVLDKAEVIYNHAFINYSKYDLDIKLDMSGNNGYTRINIHGITDGGNTRVNVDGIIGKNNFNNEFLEHIRLVNINDGKAICVPNILIANSKVAANHEATVGKLSDNELEYLMSKGIGLKSANKLILDGFIINAIKNKELVVKIKEILNTREV